MFRCSSSPFGKFDASCGRLSHLGAACSPCSTPVLPLSWTFAHQFNSDLGHFLRWLASACRSARKCPNLDLFSWHGMVLTHCIAAFVADGPAVVHPPASRSTPSVQEGRFIRVADGGSLHSFSFLGSVSFCSLGCMLCLVIRLYARTVRLPTRVELDHSPISVFFLGAVPRLSGSIMPQIRPN